jgi:phenylalanyl-tRNA synthetase beta chain
MRAPVDWLAERVDLPEGISPRALADALINVGMEVERVESAADALSGPIVVGRVVSFADEPQKNGKTIRWCRVDVGGYNAEDGPRGIVCGAANFAADDLVVVALPGAALPGDFMISARKTYGHVSDGMICSARELGIGDDHDGIVVLTADAGKPGDDALDPLGLRAAVLDVAVTTDRGYAMSIRGLAREAAAALDVGFHDVTADLAPVDGCAYDVRVDDPAGCDRFSAMTVTGLGSSAATPDWMAQRLRQCGVRPISLAVDVTNYVMLETGQPLHAFDRASLSGPIVVRRAKPGERLITLDGVDRCLDPDDLVVTDDTGAVALAGVMGGAPTEVGPDTTDVVLEAAHWDPPSISRSSRRHHLASEASRRFERGVDPQIAGIALQRCVDLLVEHGGARAEGYTVVGDPPPADLIDMDAGHPARVAGMPIERDVVITALQAVGCTVAGAELLRVRPPTWRPDLRVAADLVEEVVRLVGYDQLPAALPAPRAGRGFTPTQALHRTISRALAAAGFVETLSYPFVSPTVHDVFGLPADDPRRRALRLANPLADTEPELRTSLLPGLLATLHRNLGRGMRDLAIYETGLVFHAAPDASAVPRPGVAHRPGDAELEELYAAVPPQPRHVGAVLTGTIELRGWWGPARQVGWADALEAARVVGRAARVELAVRATQIPPWHPGRCAQLLLDGRVVGHAGELHPGVITTLGLPERTCALELDLDAFAPPPPPSAPLISPYPPVLLDVALVVGAAVPSADVLAALREGAGPLLESVRLFDVYADPDRLGADLKSLAFELRFRAPNRTLTVDEATSARDAAVAVAGERTGAAPRT